MALFLTTIIMKTIKSLIRKSDIIGFASDFKFYLWLKNSNKNNVLNILNKIQKNDRNIDYREIKKCPQKLTWKNITLEGWDING